MTEASDTLNRGDKVEVYWNSRRKLFSVRKKGRVVTYSPFLYLFHPEFVVRQSGRIKVLKTGRKNVHAWVRGEVTGCDCWWLFNEEEHHITYSPYKNDSFQCARDLKNCMVVRLSSYGDNKLTGGFYRED